MDKITIMIVLVALATLQQFQAAELGEKSKEELNKPEGAPAAETSDTMGLMPVMVLSQKSQKPTPPDFFLIWIKEYEKYFPKPMMDIINNQVQPQSEAVSAQMISTMLGADQAWSQISQAQNIINQLGLSSLISSTTGESLAELLSNISGRRRR